MKLRSGVQRIPFLLSAVFVIAAVFIVQSCRHEPAFLPATVCFETDVLPVIQSSCGKSGCHGNGSHRGGVSLNNYNDVRALVDPGYAITSRLISVLHESGENQMPPPGNTPISAAQEAVIQEWIREGATNTAACSTCDSTKFTFHDYVLPILVNRCGGCHGASQPASSIELIDYAGIQPQAVSGYLYNTINHTDGYNPMPTGQAKMPDCEIAVIRNWVNAGSLNN